MWQAPAAPAMDLFIVLAFGSPWLSRVGRGFEMFSLRLYKGLLAIRVPTFTVRDSCERRSGHTSAPRRSFEVDLARPVSESFDALLPLTLLPSPCDVVLLSCCLLRSMLMPSPHRLLSSFVRRAASHGRFA